jgi:small subunit ribosomal protein S6
MGRKTFAREINKAKAGIYWNYIFTLDPDKVEAIRNQFRLDERIIRLMIINYDRPDPKPAE